MMRSLTTQVALNTKTYLLIHDQIKLRLPTGFAPQHHLLHLSAAELAPEGEVRRVIGTDLTSSQCTGEVEGRML
jgi:hypothetical protein